MEGPVRRTRSDAVAEIRIVRPERLNALDLPSMQALRAAVQDAARDPSVRAILLTGEGRAFCAGGDVAAMDEGRRKGLLPELFRDLTGEQETVVRTILSTPKPVVAALPGVAAGGGLALALACDWRIAAPTAVLVPAFGSLGAVPDGGLTYFLPHYLGLGLAQELLFTSSRIPADRARELGLLHEVVPAEELERRSAERAKELAEGPTRAYGWVKRLLVSAFSSSVERQLALEREYAFEAAAGPELPEGILAFQEKRKPVFPPP